MTSTTNAAATGGEIAVESLIANGVDTLFGLPGVQLDHLFNALHGAQQRLKVIHARHEQGAAYMALGYALASGRVGAYAVVPGPGFLNTAAALSTAYATHAPVLAIIGQIMSGAIGKGGGELHELPDQGAILAGLTRWSGIARTPADVAGVMAGAFAALEAGRAPAGVELPADVLRDETDSEPTAPVPVTAPRQPEAVDVEAAVDLLKSAEAPLIWIGSGALEAGDLVALLAERLGAGVGCRLQARGVVPDSSDWAVGMLDGKTLWHEADVILAVGTRLHEQRKRWGLRPDQEVIRIDTDAAQFTRGTPPSVALHADARVALLAILSGLGAGNARRVATRRARVAEAKAEKKAAFEMTLAPQMAYIRAIRAALPPDSVVVCDYTQIGYVATAALPVEAPRRIITPGYQGTLGFGYATALGAKVARPDVPVVALCGDGGFLFSATELATAVQFGIPAVGVVFADGAYGNVRRMQDEQHGGKLISSDLSNPDFVRFAESFGAEARRTEGPEGLGEALRWAIGRPGPTIIEVAMPRVPSPWRLLEP
ncbi:thiamine pyrophosphate-dependent enzyme [Acuticoccus mangrovi]|uniref:TPP-binding protein n=1 Tax=Acuticoccus mangrovi TaxID=2796142 RepID=A0A934MEE8_9HYPH|nr:thiamine pyrophosphate-dependent enzyme [Acuticoccus mangrovi]MBJ3774298.1 TPP-binding protein [Acuticoccus mangrovi]